MTKIKLFLPALLALLTACSTFTVFDSVVTIKQVGDSISTEYARLYNAGLITPEQDAKAEAIHARYRQAMGGLAVALTAWQTGKEGGDVAAALRAAKEAITPLMQMIAPLLTTSEAGKLSKQLTTATAQ